MLRLAAVAVALVGIGACAPAVVPIVEAPESVEAPPPKEERKQAGKPPAPGEHVPITSNWYGGYKYAAKAPRIGEAVPDFTVPTHTGGNVTLSALAKEGPVVLMFYRGFW